MSELPNEASLRAIAQANEIAKRLGAPSVPAHLIKRLDRACYFAEHPVGMSTHDGKCSVAASDIRYLLRLLGVEPFPAEVYK